jgi:deoxynucleotide monophosphate kinase-like protein
MSRRRIDRNVVAGVSAETLPPSRHLPPFIGIAGKMAAGKDSTADILIRHFGYTRHSMADPLRAECEVAIMSCRAPETAPTDIRHTIERKEFPGYAVWLKPTDPSIRRLLQWWGTEYRRTESPNYWVNRMRERLAEFNGTPVVIPDIRFANEVDMVRSAGGEIWIVNRPKADAERDPADHSHISERFCDEYQYWDLRVRNDGTLADLGEKVKGIMQCVREKRRCQAYLAAQGEAGRPGERLGASLGEVDWTREASLIADPPA